MLHFLADENFHWEIVRSLRRRNPQIDIERAQGVGLTGRDDAAVLDWAARHGRVPLTHDVTTITRFAYERVRTGLPMPDVFEVAQSLPIGRVVDDVLLLAECSLENEYANQVKYLPL